MDEFHIVEGKCHTIAFECSKIQMNFKQLLIDYFRNRKDTECNYLKLLNKNGDVIDGRDFYFIQFDCNAINLTEDKSTNKIIQDVLFYHLENNPKLIQQYLAFDEQMNRFINEVTVNSGELMIDFQPSNKTIAQIIKSLDISIEYKASDYVPNYIMREFLIKALLQMNILDESVFLLISYPETDVGFDDFLKVMKMLKEFKVTTLVISSNYNILSAVKPNNMLLINRNGTSYDILNLRKELIAFDLVNQKQASLFAKKLAFLDFSKNYFLLDPRMKEFLLSNRL